jgi:hypothetical protein
MYVMFLGELGNGQYNAPSSPEETDILVISDKVCYNMQNLLKTFPLDSSLMIIVNL